MDEEVRVIARHSRGTETDVTEGVQALYDHMVQSMDWGSGFLSIEDAKGVIEVAQACGFVMPADAAAQFEEYAREVTRGSYGGDVICATCGEKAVWSSDWNTDKRNPGRWQPEKHRRHITLDLAPDESGQLTVLRSTVEWLDHEGNVVEQPDPTATLPKPSDRRPGWYHIGHDPQHPVILWR